jgi:hypothetical protein
MAKVPPCGKGEPPPPADTMGNLDTDDVSHLNFRVPKAFHKEFGMFAIQHDYKNQTDVLYEAIDLLKRKREGTLYVMRS